MQITHRRRAALVAAAGLGLAVLGGGLAYAATSQGSPAQQLNDPDVYACVNQAGGIDYLEYRLPIPHACWFTNETLWRLDPGGQVTPGPTVTATSG